MLLSLTRKKDDNGIRPLKPSRDLRGVADLIEEAFLSELDQSGQVAIRELRSMGRWGFLLIWLDYINPDVDTHLNGFVWVDQGRIVGNVTISRQSPASRQWFISNVAVSKTHRRRGIARLLMETAIEYVRELHGREISLQVRLDNAAASRLYESVGFQAISAVTHVQLYRVSQVKECALPEGLTIRPHRLNISDAQATYTLARLFVPPKVQSERPLHRGQFQLGAEVKWNNFWRSLVGFGRVRHWLVEDEHHQIAAALTVEPSIWQRHHKMSFLVHPDWWGRLESFLINFALIYLKPWSEHSISFQHPHEHQPGVTALIDAGFTIERTHVWMKLKVS